LKQSIIVPLGPMHFFDALLAGNSLKSPGNSQKGSPSRQPRCIHCGESHWSDEFSKYNLPQARKENLKGCCNFNLYFSFKEGYVKLWWFNCCYDQIRDISVSMPLDGDCKCLICSCTYCRPSSSLWLCLSKYVACMFLTYNI